MAYIETTLFAARLLHILMDRIWEQVLGRGPRKQNLEQNHRGPWYSIPGDTCQFVSHITFERVLAHLPNEHCQWNLNEVAQCGVRIYQLGYTSLRVRLRPPL